MSSATALPSKLDTKEIARFYQDRDVLLEGCLYPRDGVIEDFGPEVLAVGETVTIDLGAGYTTEEMTVRASSPSRKVWEMQQGFTICVSAFATSLYS
jgi:hypothetical protein